MAAQSSPVRTGGFRLVHHFTIVSLAAFLLVGAAMLWHERDQYGFIGSIQSEQAAFFGKVQDDFVREQAKAAREDLLATHEQGNVTVTRVFANALWERDIAPFIARAQAVSADECRQLSGPARKACDTALGEKLRALPGFGTLDARVREVMRQTAVFKIKVFDLRGITVYSSEVAQMGDDKIANAGWKSAAAGKPASELTHRDKFSAFEGVVENRDLISTYLPVFGPDGRVMGVFEVYSDVTALLERVNLTAKRTAEAAAANVKRVAEAKGRNDARALEEAILGVAMVAALLVALFAVLYLYVRRADRTLAAQAREREAMQQHLGQSEKMSALGQMVAGVAHQLNTPLAFSQSNVSLVRERLAELEAPMALASKLTEVARSTSGEAVTLRLGENRARVAAARVDPGDVVMMREMLGDVLNGIGQMSELVVNMREFTRLDRAAEDQVDINRGLKTVAYMARSVMPTTVKIVEEFGDLPLVHCNPSQLNQVFLNLVTNAAQAIDGEGTVTIRSFPMDGRVRVDVTDTGRGIPADVLPHIFESFYTTKPRGEGTGLGLAIARDIVTAHGGEILVDTEPGRGTTFSVLLPAGPAPVELKEAA